MFIACLSLLLLATYIHFVSGMGIFPDRGSIVAAPHRPEIGISGLDCFGSGSHPPHLPDCHTAIAMIPSGNLRVDPQPHSLGETERFDTSILEQYRDRKFFLPAAFHQGSCVVAIDAAAASVRSPPPKNAASEMYFTLWPSVRVLVNIILKECLGNRSFHTGGTTHAESRLGEFLFPYYVTVIPTPEGFPGDGWQARLTCGVRDVVYNVYEPGGSALGHGTRGIWNPLSRLN